MPIVKPIIRLLTCAGPLVFLFATTLSFAQTPPPSRYAPRFPPGAIWSQDISGVLPDTNSSTMIAGSGGWGTGTTKFQIDFSMHTVYTSWGNVQNYPLVQEGGYYLPDCDTDSPIPLPGTGAIEGSSDYTCDLGDDCHLFVVNGDTLYESYKSTVVASGSGAGLNSLCLIKWHLNLVYPANGRGDECTTADAAGFPMAPLIISADDVFAATQVTNGDLGHAIRFILENSSMRSDNAGETMYYVHPASHAGAPTGPSGAIPYGARLRLKPGFAISGFNAASQVILRTMQKYGIFLADGGNLPLTFQDDMFTVHKWADADINIDSHSLYGVALTDFEVMPIGTPIPFTAQNENCVRNGFGEDVIFADGYNW
jgi:hypothetical protein